MVLVLVPESMMATELGQVFDLVAGAASLGGGRVEQVFDQFLVVALRGVPIPVHVPTVDAHVIHNRRFIPTRALLDMAIFLPAGVHIDDLVALPGGQVLEDGRGHAVMGLALLAPGVGKSIHLKSIIFPTTLPLLTNQISCSGINGLDSILTPMIDASAPGIGSVGMIPQTCL